MESFIDKWILITFKDKSKVIGVLDKIDNWGLVLVNLASYEIKYDECGEKYFSINGIRFNNTASHEIYFHKSGVYFMRNDIISIYY